MRLVRVTKVWYEEDSKYPNINSGLVLELEDGRLMSHSQDTPVVPFAVQGGGAEYAKMFIKKDNEGKGGGVGFAAAEALQVPAWIDRVDYYKIPEGYDINMDGIFHIQNYTMGPLYVSRKLPRGEK